MKRLLYLAMVALVALLILVPTAAAQEMTKEVQQEVKVEGTAPLPKCNDLRCRVVFPAKPFQRLREFAVVVVVGSFSFRCCRN